MSSGKRALWGAILGAMPGFALLLIAVTSVSLDGGRDPVALMIIAVVVFALPIFLGGAVLGALIGLVAKPLSRQLYPPISPLWCLMNPPRDAPDAAALLRAADLLDREGKWKQALSQYRQAAAQLRGQLDGEFVKDRIRELRKKIKRPEPGAGGE